MKINHSILVAVSISLICMGSAYGQESTVEQTLNDPDTKIVSGSSQNSKVSMFSIKDTLKGFTPEESRRFMQEFS